MRRNWMMMNLCLCFLLILGWQVHGAEVMGTADSILVYSQDFDQWRSQFSFDLRYIQGFGYTSKVLVHPLISLRTTGLTQVMDLEIKEAYYDLYLDSLDLRLGKQMVNWGNSMMMSPLNIVNPQNLGAEDPLQMPLGVWGATAKYYFDYQTELTGVVVCAFEPTRVPQRMIDARTQEMEEQLVADLVAEGWSETDARERFVLLMENKDAAVPIIDQWQEMEYGARFTRRGVGAFDLSLCYYEGYEDLIRLESDLGEIAGELARGAGSEQRLEFEFIRERTLGASAVGFIGPVGIWAEGAWHRNLADEQRIDSVVGGDLTLRNGLNTVVQFYHSRNLGPWGLDDAEMGSESYLMLMNQLPFQRIHRLRNIFVYDWQEDGYLIAPELNFSVKTDLSLQVGAICKGGQVSSLIDSFGEAKYYVKLTYGF